MRIATTVASLPLLLAACHAEVDRKGADGSGDDVHVAVNADAGKDGVSVDLPGFGAKVTLPGLDLGRHVDLDGIRVAPGTAVHGVDVSGRDGQDKGVVRIDFTSPQAPAALADYYARAATAASYREVTVAGDTVTAAKGDKRFAMTASPGGGGSRGTITMSGGG